MGKPLLTDEIIEKANRGEDFQTAYPYDELGVKTKQNDISDDIGIEVHHQRGSRRLETAKRRAFTHKLNLILLVLLLILAVVVYAVFHW